MNYVQKDDTAISVQHPRNLGDDDWDTIISKVQNGNGSLYVVGSTKEVDMGTLGTHTLRVANTSTPAECSTSGFSQTACGFVLEFADLITQYKMNNSNTNSGGWKDSLLRTYLNNDIYNSFPNNLKSHIIDTNVISGYGCISNFNGFKTCYNPDNSGNNIETVDKIYNLSPYEIWEDVDGNDENGIDAWDTSYVNTRQLDFYKNMNNTTSNYGAEKKSYKSWWLRSAANYFGFYFFSVRTLGNWATLNATEEICVSPAFRLG